MATTKSVVKPKTERHPRQSEEVEKFLKEFGVDWKFNADTPLDMWDIEGSLNNQARFSKINSEMVADYAADMSNGDVFPPNIVAAGPKGTFWNLDGNHRMMAAVKLERTALDAYIVLNAPRDVLTLITQVANLKHGMGLSPDERLGHAAWRVRSGTASVAKAARLFSLEESTLTNFLRKAKSDARADDNGILQSDWGQLNITTKTKLSSIHTDEAFRPAVSLALKAGLTGDEIHYLVKKLNEAGKSAERQLAVMKTFEEVYAERARASANGMISKATSKRAPSPATRLRLGLGQLSSQHLPSNFGALVKDWSPLELPGVLEEAIEVRDRLDGFIQVAQGALGD